MNEIHFGGQLTETEYRQINSLALRKAKVLLGVFAAIFVIWNMITVGEEDGFGLGFWLSTGIPLAFVAAFWLLFPGFFVRRQWRSNKMLQQPISGTISDEGITWNIANLSTSRIPWNLLLQYRKSESLILVYQGVNQVYYFPRQYFSSDQDWADFQSILATKLQPK